MKKIFVLITILAAAISCSKEQEAQLTPLTFTAVGEQTKTSLDGQSIVWSTSDHVKVFASADYDTPYNFAVTSTENSGRKATIEGLGTVSPEYYVLFPYQADAAFNGAEMTLTIPTDQAAVASSFGPSANPAIAYIAGTEELLFKNVGALLAVNIQAADVTGLKVESLDGTEMTGLAQFDCAGSEPVLNDFVGGQGKAYVQTTVSGAGVYYLVVAPGSYTGGFRLTFTKSGYKAVVENTKALTVARNDNVNLFSTPTDIPWQVDFTPGDRVFIKGLADANENGQEVSYIPAGYYAPRAGGSAPSSPAPGDDSALAGITYNYEVWAKIAKNDEVYFETENGGRFAVNVAADAVAPIAADEVGPKISVSESPYRIRLNLPSGDAQVVRVGIVNWGIIYGTIGVSQNLSYDRAGAWKLDNYAFQHDTQSWDPNLSRYRFSIWFNWFGGQGGANCDIWQRYGTCTLNNNLGTQPSTDNPAEEYYYVQPFNGDGWDTIFYMPDWLFNGWVSETKRGTINLYMNNTYGHFTHGFSNVVDNI